MHAKAPLIIGPAPKRTERSRRSAVLDHAHQHGHQAVEGVRDPRRWRRSLLLLDPRQQRVDALKQGRHVQRGPCAMPPAWLGGRHDVPHATKLYRLL